MIAVALLAVSFAGCLGGSTNPPPSGNNVNIQNFAFNSANITVHVGQSVTWKNLDGVTHTITSDSDAPVIFDSGFIVNGQSYIRVFTQVGTYHYHCTIHTFMVGVVQVVP